MNQELINNNNHQPAGLAKLEIEQDLLKVSTVYSGAITRKLLSMKPRYNFILL